MLPHNHRPFPLICLLITLVSFVGNTNSRLLMAQEGTEVASLEGYQLTIPAMGVRFRIQFYCQNPERAQQAFQRCQSLLAKLEHCFTDYDENSEAMLLCHLPDNTRFPASNDFLQLLDTATQVQTKTQGCFHPALGNLTSIWRQIRRAEGDRLEQLQQDFALAIEQWLQVGNQPLYEYDLPHGVFQKHNHPFRFDFGGIAKGYAADRLIQMLKEEFQITAVMVDASGDITVSGSPPEAEGWQIGISGWDPRQGVDHRVLLKEGSVASSGDARQFANIDRQRRSHLFDPRNGQPIPGHHLTVVYHPRGDIADALASAFSVCTNEEFQRILNSFPEAAAYRLHQIDGQIEKVESDNWQTWMKQHQINPQSP